MFTRVHTFNFSYCSSFVCLADFKKCGVLPGLVGVSDVFTLFSLCSLWLNWILVFTVHSIARFADILRTIFLTQFTILKASDRFNINSQLEHLQAKYVGTGHADLSRL
jgi:hypothetical protein